jgi:hypothetical protein
MKKDRSTNEGIGLKNIVKLKVGARLFIQIRLLLNEQRVENRIKLMKKMSWLK